MASSAQLIMTAGWRDPLSVRIRGSCRQGTWGRECLLDRNGIVLDYQQLLLEPDSSPSVRLGSRTNNSPIQEPRQLEAFHSSHPYHPFIPHPSAILSGRPPK